MDPYDLLSLIVEVAIGIAGFAGVIAALKYSEIHTWPIGDVVNFQVILTASASAIFFGFLPAILSVANVAESDIWRYASVVAAIVISIGVSARLVQLRKSGGTLWRMMLEGAVIWGLSVGNSFLGFVWPYFAMLVLMLGYAFLSFVSVVVKIVSKTKEN